jgi:hypothetical protein
VTITAEDILNEAIRGWQGGTKWYKGTGGRGPNGETCLAVGLSDARKRLTQSNSERHYREAAAAWQEAGNAVRSLTGYSLAGWNDHRSRTYEDVLLVVELARANLKREANK